MKRLSRAVLPVLALLGLFAGGSAASAQGYFEDDAPRPRWHHRNDWDRPQTYDRWHHREWRGDRFDRYDRDRLGRDRFDRDRDQDFGRRRDFDRETPRREGRERRERRNDQPGTQERLGGDRPNNPGRPAAPGTGRDFGGFDDRT